MSSTGAILHCVKNSWIIWVTKYFVSWIKKICFPWQTVKVLDAIAFWLGNFDIERDIFSETI